MCEIATQNEDVTMNEALWMVEWVEGEVKKYHFACDLQTEKRLLNCGLWRQTKQVCTLEKGENFILGFFFFCEINLLQLIELKNDGQVKNMNGRIFQNNLKTIIL